jgi:CoA:oxalate CoA-transferase
MFTAIGVLSAVQERHLSGKGQMVDVAMLDSQIAILENAMVRYFVAGEVPRPLGTRHPLLTPFQAFPTQDGYIVLTLTGGGENIWPLFAVRIGRIDLVDDPRFQTNADRSAHHAELEAEITAALADRTTAEWVEEFEDLGIPCGPLNDIAQAAVDPQVVARQMIVDVQHPQAGGIKVSGTPVKLSRTPAEVRGPSPDIGQHTNEVLKELLGLTDEQIDALRQQDAL